MPQHKITQKSIAQKLGLTQAAVSLALRGDASIPEATRKKVSKMAKKLGYVPDPYLTGLSAYRHRNKPTPVKAALAWLSNDAAGESWKRSPAFVQYHTGALRRAQELGYHLEDHALQAQGVNMKNIERVLLARGVNGILLAPQPAPNMSIDFTFTKFSAVTFGYTLCSPQLHVVTLHQFRAMEKLLRKLTGFGYQRIGLALSSESDGRADYHWSAAFWRKQQHFPAKQQVPLHLPQQMEKEGFLKWYAQHRPEVVVTIHPEVYDWLHQDGIAIPEDLGFTLLTVPDDQRQFSGIWENPALIGAKAVDILVEMIHRGETGIPEVPIYHLIDGNWLDGETVKNKTRRVKPC
ncbi:LacI family DNA-binding transcriptional regulator [Coraliomargarita algicola]|uniref:LacI family DNA-binding transcriptional regulator n=1 Tax=Coraliomargarita algicola TaxID=3092156 RepID=A0ABZ0RQ88_9BACT|nr:LacI family DNA-binding transcriptional regulator [Coraliomargarita sp. J2-16]WPJ96935.1 LacI family DNA-binding transcriptional regulator [Coraliomargarita sp. J2-16]